jgi:integrase
MKFTDTYVRCLEPELQKYYRREANGFALCVYPSGVKSWFFIYTHEGKRCSMALGNYPDVRLNDARSLYNKAWQVYADGHNPAQIAQAEALERKLAPTVSELIDLYIERYAKLHKRSWKQDEWALNKYVRPVWGSRKANEIRRKDIVQLLDSVYTVTADGKVQGAGMANQLRKYLSKMFVYAVGLEIMDNTPMIKVDAAPTKPKKRALEDEEILQLWSALDNSKLIMSDTVRRILKLILVTGQRPGDVAGMHKAEITGNVWTIPAERYKTDIEQNVHLSELALSLIGNDHRGGYVFPTPHTRKWKPLSAHSLCAAVRRNMSLFGVNKFTPHDLRRTCATGIAKLGYPDDTINAVLGHVKAGIIKTYNRHKYENEKRVALQEWTGKLLPMLGLIEVEYPEWYDPNEPIEARVI